MKSLVAIIGLSGAAVAVGAASAGSHDLYFARVAHYQSMQGFNHVVAGTRFTGFFMPHRGACSVSLVISDADDETLRRAPQHLRFDLTATQGIDIAASEREAFGMACSSDADELSVAKLSRTEARTAQRN